MIIPTRKDRISRIVRRLFFCLFCIVVWKYFQGDETWVVPRIEIRITDSKNRLLPVNDFNLKIHRRHLRKPDTLDDEITWKLGRDGSISVPAVKVVMQTGIGNPCFWTGVELTSEKITANEELVICGGDTVGSEPPPRYRVSFVLNKERERWSTKVECLRKDGTKPKPQPRPWDGTTK